MAENEITGTALDRNRINETFDNMQAEAVIAIDAISFLENLLLGTVHKGFDDEELAGISMLIEGIAGKLRLIEGMASSGMAILRRSEDTNA